jgi:hypothetical protein
MRRTKHVELDGQPKSWTIGKKGIEREGNQAGEERNPGPNHRKATGGELVERARRVGEKARKLEQAGEAETRRRASIGRDAEDEVAPRSRKAKVARRNVASGGHG